MTYVKLHNFIYINRFYYYLSIFIYMSQVGFTEGNVKESTFIPDSPMTCKVSVGEEKFSCSDSKGVSRSGFVLFAQHQLLHFLCGLLWKLWLPFKHMAVCSCWLPLSRSGCILLPKEMRNLFKEDLDLFCRFSFSALLTRDQFAEKECLWNMKALCPYYMALFNTDKPFAA